ncbi:protein-disulfide reductase DsbD domain-containing protein [Sinomicrobium weinanense]|uniref:Thiol:disulfide interchange protein DsbD N-terminal domain-containing protein n=1 Tax=Sinomicrobium weinanense TaxID=2842200 RepID=A0A926JUI9_9FLAO|nr:protein-disulfide reductase DsbD domain-containing protein [Sinomicrobium weinanense]MBC9797720.1 hypothetical protein [Sinomicrobium weinanense]MBU3122254.1 hypothetical protein [Sinomicrobium weinanense]
MQRCLLLIWIFTFHVTILPAQGLDSVEWNFTSKRLDDKTYEVRISAEMEYPWHIYSQYTKDGGPLPTDIVFTDNPAIELEGEIKEEGGLIEKYEELFMVDTSYYIGRVDFIQRVKVKKETPQVLKGSVTFMACTDKQGLTPQQVEFNIKLN